MTLVASSDVCDDAWRNLAEAGRDQVRTWLVEHGLDPADVYRVEVHVIDCPLLRAFRYAREDGRMVVDPDRPDEVLRLPPLDVLITTDPPAGLCPKVLP